MHEIERELKRQSKPRYGSKHTHKAAHREVFSLKMHDWNTLAQVVIEMRGYILNHDHIEHALRSVRMDSRFLDPDRITIDHMKLAMHLTTIGQLTPKTEEEMS